MSACCLNTGLFCVRFMCYGRMMFWERLDLHNSQRGECMCFQKEMEKGLVDGQCVRRSTLFFLFLDSAGAFVLYSLMWQHPY